MLRSLSKKELSQFVSQRGTGKAINRKEVIVYDFMPVILGNKFRTEDVLSRMLLRSAPVGAPFMLKTNAYETLGIKYVDNEKLIPALECYRIALDSRTSFVKMIASLQKNVLLNKNEIKHMNVSTELEKRLVEEVVKLKGGHNQTAYDSWVEELRTLRKNFYELNRNDYGSSGYIEACLKIGEYEEALANAEYIGDKKLIRRVKRIQPKEILDVKFLNKFIDNNHPESSLFR